MNKKKNKNQTGFALGLVIVVIAALAILLLALFFYSDLELSAFNNSQKNKLAQNMANYGIDSAFNRLNNDAAQTFNQIDIYSSPMPITNSICISSIDNSNIYVFNSQKNLTSIPYSTDDYSNYGYEYFIRKNFIDDFNINYTIISCATFNNQPIAFLSLDVSTTLVPQPGTWDDNTNLYIAVQRLGITNKVN